MYTLSVLLGCPFPGPLARESWLLLGLLVCTHWHFWVFIFFSSKLTYIRQEKAKQDRNIRQKQEMKDIKIGRKR